MFLITSAAYVTPGLASEFGKLPPCMLPVQNRRLYEHQLALAPKDESVVLSLPQSYSITTYDKKRLENSGVRVIFVPDSLSLGQSVVYVLNVVGKYQEPLYILHGDTLFSDLSLETDFCAIAEAADNYDWATAEVQDEIYAGFFSFSNQSLLIQKITENHYNFIDGIRGYSQFNKIKNGALPNWMDFGLVNTYYRSISKMTTQRVFNSMKVTRYSVQKSSLDKRKMEAESNWMLSIPIPMKHYVPTVWDKGEKGNLGYYEIEYYFLSSLANLFVFGNVRPYVWKDIIDACIDYLNEEIQYKPDNYYEIAKQNDLLYSNKTIKRLEDYVKQTGISLDSPWTINGTIVPSLKGILSEIDANISKNDVRFVSMMHGDPCFSNILYDFKSRSIKVIDPRGVDLDGNLSIYGDFRYDVGKLAHSVLGMYDYIIGGMYEYEKLGPYNLVLKFEISNELKQVQDYFRHQTFGGYTLEDLSTYPVLIHLFLSMLPLHNDCPERQMAFLANALRLYVEQKNNIL